jgi:GR25 family glycosyltransferase involved in LPS biosynthesis
MSVPEIHLLNLDRSTTRLQRFWYRNRHLDNVVRVPAVDGAKIDRAQMINAGYITQDFECAAGSLGCAISHIELWRQAVRENRPLTILEDDVVVANHFATAAARVMSDLSTDWDMVKWGFTGSLTAWLDIALSRAKVHWEWASTRRDSRSLAAFQNAEVPAAPIKMMQSYGLFAYSISPKGARAALDYCLPLRKREIELPDASTVETKGIDTTLSGALPKLQTFVCLPNLVIHADEGESDRMNLDRIDSTK